ncbi:MAG: hypothetical protein PUB18_05000 [bacterium]|nr:hypothetical protein [bacterium]
MKKYFILLIVIGLGITLATIFYFNQDSTKSNQKDSKKFSEEYEIGVDNVFVYSTGEEILNIMKNGTGIVYLGFPECPWCKAYVSYLNDFAKEEGIEKIYYYNILEDRKNNTKLYQEMVSILGEHLQYNDEGKHRIYVPNVSFHVKGKIIGNDYETSLDTHNLEKPEEYWTKKEVTDLENKLKPYMKEVYIATNTCSDCNK